MIGVMDWIEKELLIQPDLQVKIFKTMFIIFIMILIYFAIRKLLYNLVEDNQVYYKVKKTVSYIIVIIIFIMVGRVWFEGVQSLATFIGLFSAALAIVMKDVILNIAGWIYIILKSPFRVGDRIEIGDIAGDVIDVQVFSFALMEIQNWVDADQSTGRIVYIPNVFIFNKALLNYSKGIPYIWNEIPISIPLESNWKKAKSILTDIAEKYGEVISSKAEGSIKEASKKFSLYNAQLNPTVYTKIDPDSTSIILTIRYMCSYRNRRGSAEKIYEDILDEFMKHKDIEFSYPTQIIYTEDEKNRVINTRF
ncbi:MAG: mechanosensitive ion channel family protein [Tissierella sp.]|uniref:mechanosensitive ion channel family protein n=1 Tax=Tissierella sp. TaxID=41274 RepID=UPI003F9D1E67